MANVIPPAGGPPFGVPPVPNVVAPPLLFPVAAGTIIGWLVDQLVLVTSILLVADIEAGYARLFYNIPGDPNDPGYRRAMRELIGKVVNSAELCCYLTILETGGVASRVTLVHSIGKYSAGFGALSEFQGTIMGFLGETIGENLPLFVQAPQRRRRSRLDLIVRPPGTHGPYGGGNCGILHLRHMWYNSREHGSARAFVLDPIRRGRIFSGFKMSVRGMANGMQFDSNFGHPSAKGSSITICQLVASGVRETRLAGWRPEI
jgi:hypothetical protein